MKDFLLCLLIFYPIMGLSEKLILSVGEKVFLPLNNNLKVLIGDKNLVFLQIQKKSLLLQGRKKGQTKLLVGNKTYKLFVFDKSTKRKALQWDGLVKKLWGLDWSLNEKSVFQITGQLNAVSDWVELSKTSKKHQILYEFTASFGENLEPQIKTYFKKLFVNQIPAEIQWNNLPIALIPEASDKKNYETKLRAFGLIVKEDPLWFVNTPFIEIEVALVETSSSSHFTFGSETKTQELYSHFSNLLNFLNFLKSSGKGKTLHHSTVMTQSGQNIQIQTGGQIPFKAYNLNTQEQNTQWKSYGLNLNLLPKLDKKNLIELKIKAEISEPLSLSSIDSPAPIKTQNLESTLKLREGKLLKIFHLRKKGTSQAYKGGLGFIFSPQFLTGNNKYEINQFVLLQVKIIKQVSIPNTSSTKNNSYPSKKINNLKDIGNQ